MTMPMTPLHAARGTCIRTSAQPGAHTLSWAAARALLVPLMLGVLLVLARPAATPPVRSVTLAATPLDVAPDARASRAFVLGDDGTVGVVDLTTARLVRTIGRRQAGAELYLSMALDARTQRLFVADPLDGLTPGVVRVWDSRSGAPLAAVRVGRGTSALAVDERSNRLFVANAADRTISVLDARSGRPRCIVRLEAPPLALAVDAPASRVVVLAAGALHDTAQGSNGYWPGPSQVSVLDARSGRLLYTVTVGIGPGELAVDARRGRVFVSNRGDDTVSVLDAVSGRLLRTVAVGRFPTTLALDERRGTVYVVNAGDGTLSLLDARGGALQRTLHVVNLSAGSLFAAPLDALAVDETRARVYLSAWGPSAQVDDALGLRGPGTLYVLDARTGALRRRLTVGVAPLAVAVEPGSGRVVVLNAGGVVPAPQGWLAPLARRLRMWLPWLGPLNGPVSVSRLVPGSVSVLNAQD